ncbi:hypothetical protein [Sporichthya sp.]|uniref:hypothetical protein n=1 Tax=Sporichthya sp. TaxID=65475 RepID=UPI001802770B|nr:hypothetical protein [Sporichthya sp.]MBA3741452.1 hypothetical protein [Sporichthya sp.]
MRSEAADISRVLDELSAPPQLWSRAEVLHTPCPVPTGAGIYGWHFDSGHEKLPGDGHETARWRP